MKASELNKDYDGYLCSCRTYENWQKYLIPLQMGRILPCNPFQARYYLKSDINLGRLNRDDVDVLESLFSEFGMSGDYDVRDGWIWLVNQDDLKKAIKLKFKI